MATFTESDVEFFRHGDEPLLAHLYRPDGPGPFPAVVSIHGGAWTSNDRFSTAETDRFLAASGIVVLALDVRLGQVAKFPGQVVDANVGIRWLKAHAEELGSRPGLVGGVGSSSGGHVVLLTALRPTDPTLACLPLAGAPEITAELAYVVACWPVADPLARYRLAQERGNEHLLTAHGIFWRDEAEMAAGNPQLVLERGEATHVPPALIVQGTADDNLPPDSAQRLAEAYRRAGGTADLQLFAGEPHGFIKRDPAAAGPRRALETIAAFVLEHARAAVR
jgi:acetyl esterase/lipase